MNKTGRFFLLLMLVLASASCIRALEPEETNETGNVLRARIADSGTKTSYADDGKCTWADGDQVALHYTDGAYVTYSVNPENGHLVVGNYKVSSSVQRDGLAIYPASSALTDKADESDLYINLSQEDYPEAWASTLIYTNSEFVSKPVANLGGIAGLYLKEEVRTTTMPLIADNSTGDALLDFRHVCGMLRLNIANVLEEVTDIEVEFSHRITGDFKVANPKSDNPTINTVPSVQGNKMTFHIGSCWGDEFFDVPSRSIWIDIPLPCGTYEWVNVKTYNRQWTGQEYYYHLCSDKRITWPQTVERGHGYHLSTDARSYREGTMSFVVTFSGPTTYSFPFLLYNHDNPDQLVARVDWGDGSGVTEYYGGSNISPSPSHYYDQAGDYEIVLTINLPTGYMHDLFHFMPYNDIRIKAFTSPLLKINGRIGIRSSSLISIHKDFFINNSHQTEMPYFSCPALVGYGWQLGDDNETFQAIKERGLPERLFAPLNSSFGSFLQAFDGCSSLTTIPSDLFAYHPRAKRFDRTFRKCYSLKAIPEDLFANNPDAETIQDTFRDCRGLIEIPERLFAKNKKIKDFAGAFFGCASLTNIPENLFVNNPEVQTFHATFFSCSGLRGQIPGGLFRNNLLVENFATTFSSCENITGVGDGLFAKQLFAYRFWGCFNGCSSLLLSENIFLDSAVDKTTRFRNVDKVDFCNFAKDVLGGTAPDLWNYYYNEPLPLNYTQYAFPSTVSNYADVPTAWR